MGCRWRSIVGGTKSRLPRSTVGSGERVLASGCLAHARRKFYDATSSHPALAAEALAYFGRLYDIEDIARDLSPEDRQALRQREAMTVLERLKAWADE